MKKWISYILLSALLFTAIPSLDVSAAETDWSGKLTANGNNINVTLAAPQAEPVNITSLHFRIQVSAGSGKMDAPTFKFADTVESKVKDAAAIKDTASGYILDIVISGTKDQNIFKTRQAGIGTITLHPAASTYKITAGFTGLTSENKEPAAEYMTSEGQFAQEVLLTDTRLVTIEKKTSGSGGGSFISGGGVSVDYSIASAIPAPSNSPDASKTPENTQVPAVSAAPGSSSVPAASSAPGISPVPAASSAPGISPVPDPAATATTAPETPAASQEPVSFDSQNKPQGKAAIKKGSSHINFNWNKIDGADGYIICQYNKTNSRYKTIKTISNPEKTTCSITMNPATSYIFRIRAFTISEDNSKIYGRYSDAIKITTAPASIKGLRAKRARNSKVSLSWKRVPGARGYQIFSSRNKNGRYSLAKTVKKGSIINTKIKQKGKKTYYYKIRAYVTNASKKRVYGNFCKSIPSKS